ACGMQGLEGCTLAPNALVRLMRAYLAAYSLPHRPTAPSPRRSVAPSLIRLLLGRGVRFQGEWEPAIALEPLPLPRWLELRRGEAGARLARLSPGEPLWQVIARLYEAPVRMALLPLALLWLPLLAATLVLAGSGRADLPGGYAPLLAGAALSLA